MSGRKIGSSSIDSEHSIPDLEPRTRRAIEEEMDVLFVGIGTYVVHSESGNQYEVDVFETSCTCPDWESPNTPPRCKHIRRVQFEIDAGTVPRPDGRIADPPSSTSQARPTIPSEHQTPTEKKGRVTGPIPEFDEYRRSTGATYWRCESCGREALRKRDLRTCRCDDG